MSLDHVILCETSLLLKVVYVLRKIILYKPLILQNLTKMVHVRSLKFCHIQEIICQFVKSFRLFFEELYVEYCLWGW